jgi:hypothetical protein
VHAVCPGRKRLIAHVKQDVAPEKFECVDMSHSKHEDEPVVF